jgi:cytochrome c-type biogenesis protein CcmE
MFTKKIKTRLLFLISIISLTIFFLFFIYLNLKQNILVFNGAVPNLFSEERGAVVEGKLSDKKYLIAERILAKHDENYMPPQMKKILEKNVK